MIVNLYDVWSFWRAKSKWPYYCREAWLIQVKYMAGLPVPNTIHFSAILDVNMFVCMYVLQIFWKPT